jgi:predicted regulator of Ras-like GTPase activity (Roadblock/LC7/MglB family)
MTAVDEAGPVPAVRSTSQLISDVVRQFRREVPECIGSGLVDMSTGMLLAVDTLDDHPGEVLDLLAAATFDLFQGRNVVMIEDIFKARDGVRDDRHHFQEILAHGDTLVHVFLRSRNQDMVAVVICNRTANTGMLLAQARLIMKQLDAGLGG